MRRARSLRAPALGLAAVLLLALAFLAVRALTDTTPARTAARYDMSPPTGRSASLGGLVPLPDGAGCLKGSGGKTYYPCNPGRVRGMFDVSDIAITRDGRFAYAVSLHAGETTDGELVQGGTISAFRRNRRTGKLTQLKGRAACVRDMHARLTRVTSSCEPARGLRGAKRIVLSPDNRHVYVASLDNNAIAVFVRSRGTGALGQAAGTAACIQDVTLPRKDCPKEAVGLSGVRWIDITRDGRHLYSASPARDNIAAFSRDPATGELTQLAGAAACIEDHRATPRTECPTSARGVSHPRTITVTPDGRNVYVAANNADSAYGDPSNPVTGNAVSEFARDADTGALTQLPGDDACIEDRRADVPGNCPTVGRGLYAAFHVAVSPDGNNVYVSSHGHAGRGQVAIFDRDRETGALTQLPGQAGMISGARDCQLAGATDCQLARGGQGVDATTISQDGGNAYMAHFFNTLSISAWARDRQTGVLRQLRGRWSCIRDPKGTGCPVVGQSLFGARIVVLSPDGRFAYVPAAVSGTITIYKRRR